MKTNKFILLFIPLFIAALSAMGQSASVKDLSQFEWLEGTWQRTDAKPGYQAYEKWSIVNNQEYEGIGVTIKGRDTVFVEKLKLIIVDNAAYYVANVSSNASPVNFKITAFDDEGFISSNPSHDFPKKIQYKRHANKIKATISGNGKSIDFNFKKSE